jgi:hypothetical protein
MTTQEREKKLAKAEASLKRTLTRIKRLQTASSRWEDRVRYHRSKLAYERALTRAQGRFFRTSNG